MPKYITLPNKAVEKKTIIKDFHTLTAFPNVIGTMDCTNKVIKSPFFKGSCLPYKVIWGDSR